MTTLDTKETFSIGAITSTVAVLLSQPFDYIKVSQQLTAHARFNPSSAFNIEGNAVKSILGLGGHWAGLDSVILRQGVYGTARLMICLDLVNKAEEEEVSTVSMGGLIYNAFGGALAGLIANPFDLTLVRAQGDHLLKPEAQRNYKHAFDGIGKIMAQEGGFQALFKGALPNAIRCSLLNSLVLPIYGVFSRIERKFSRVDSIANPFSLLAATMIAGAFILPFDNVRVRVQHIDVKSSPFKSVFGCANNVLANEGFLGFYTGYLAFTARTSLMYLTYIYLADSLAKRFTSSE